ncbi:cAMP-binding domain of CRP or a regulatory subunit of cAMP-dependent protein kinases [Microvirga guangxiensis]|uniref:cAMP-binding domain of CRP or a regulatory subunit of cAMP-dependent protein kinases n=2 Tax=Microvirga guangxiensis TaxID=549386 RepID=A0A1G5BKX7_9HYPH|nr:Crp/Fnr family transcriptional regulator [Microvirga guangxiensis]SCX90540.1 cAMP-binding domain of CRP or a regulatory subunit of cAMP-dependent protein kinases [Microvirga guangxiensis]
MQHGSNAIVHRKNRLLAALEPEDFSALEPYLEVVELPKNKIIYDIGETVGYAYFPHDTIVSLTTVLKDGSSVEMAVFGREAMFGLISALVTRQSFGRYVAQFSGTASRISVEKLNDAGQGRPKIRQLVLSYTEALMAQTLQTVACNAVHSVEARCCRWILSTRDRVDHDALPLTHETLAELLGVQRSTVSSVTRALQIAGLIHQGRGVITITDRAGLEEMSCECYRKIRKSFERLLPRSYSASPQKS